MRKRGWPHALVETLLSALLTNGCLLPLDHSNPEDEPLILRSPTGKLCLDGHAEGDSFRVRLIERYSDTSNYRHDGRARLQKNCREAGFVDSVPLSADQEVVIRLARVRGTTCGCDVHDIETEPELIEGQLDDGYPFPCGNVVASTTRRSKQDGTEIRATLSLASPSRSPFASAVDRELPPLVLERLIHATSSEAVTVRCGEAWVAEVVP